MRLSRYGCYLTSLQEVSSQPIDYGLSMTNDTTLTTKNKSVQAYSVQQSENRDQKPYRVLVQQLLW